MSPCPLCIPGDDVFGNAIPNVHVHLIPRYRGDAPNPRGGVRGVVPNKQSH